MQSQTSILGFRMSAPHISKEEQRIFQNEAELLHFLKQSDKPHLLFLNLKEISNPKKFCEKLQSAHRHSDWVLDLTSVDSKNLKDIIVFPQLSEFLENINPQNLRTLIEGLLEKGQSQSLLELFQERNEKLQNENQNLNKKILRRKKTSELAENRMIEQNRNLELISKGLVSIQTVQSISLLEKTLHQLVSNLFHVSWVRILFEGQTALDRIFSDKNLITFQLGLHSAQHKWWLVISPESKHELSEQESEFLEEISESAALSVDRIINLEKAEGIKQQWDATFDAISNPLCLVDDELKIIRTNKAFSIHAKTKFSDLIGKNALKEFFKDNPEIWKRPPPLNLKLQIESQADGKYYSLVIHDLHFHIDKKRAHLLLIQDITSQYRLEKQIREKTKLVELGTIGSSIAHELNNPLAGMLSYLQLILMEIEKSSPLYEEVKEMEAATLKCRDIVQNLLGFSRKQSENQRTLISLISLIEKAIQLVEIQSRFSGVKFDLKWPSNKTPMVLGDQNALVQGLTHILTNSIEALQEKLSKEPNFIAEIKISIETAENQYRVLISDNGPGISSKNLEQVLNPLFSTKTGPAHSGLGLTVAYSIFSEHDGGLELTSPKGKGVTAIISLPRPELGPDSRGIDTQI